MDPRGSFERARVYAETRGIAIAVEDRLGIGQDGAVWSTSRRTAVKSLDREQNYQNERDSYLRLREREITEIAGLSVPALVDFDDTLRIVEMGIVSPPYLLDFGKAYVDREPPYTAEQLAESEAIAMEDFESTDREIVEEVMFELSLLGIVYLDIKPANVRIR